MSVTKKSLDIDDFRQPIKQENGEIAVNKEGKTLYAYKIDEKNGLRDFLQFKENQLSQADYCLIDKENNQVQFIEMTDLSAEMKSCYQAEMAFSQEDVANLAELLRKNKGKAIKTMQSKVWSEVIDEIKNKWMGSMAILERYARESDLPKGIFYNYSMLIVLTNNSETKPLETPLKKLDGMIPNIKVCNTKHIVQDMFGDDVNFLLIEMTN